MPENETLKLMIWDEAKKWTDEKGSVITGPVRSILDDPTAPEFSYVAAAIQKAIELLHKSEAVKTMVQMAQDFKKYKPNLKTPFKTNDDVSKWVTNTFLPSLITHFPLVVIYKESSGQFLAFTYRGSYEEQRRGKGIYLSVDKQSITTMKRYADYDEDGKTTTPDSTRYQRCMAAMIVTLLHEIGGHLLFAHVTGLGRDYDTPPEMRHVSQDFDEENPLDVMGTRAESGILFTNNLFGVDIRIKQFHDDAIYMRTISGDEFREYELPATTIEALLNGHESAFSNELGEAHAEAPSKKSTLPTKSLPEVSTEEPKVKALHMRLSDVPFTSDLAQIIFVGKGASIHRVPFDGTDRFEILETGDETGDKRKYESSSESDTKTTVPKAGTSKGSAPKKSK